MKKKFIIILLILILLTGCGKNNDAKKGINAPEEIEQNVFEYLIKQNFISEERISKFEITKIYKKGYYKTNKNVYYLQFYCTYECQDGTDTCILNNTSDSIINRWLSKTEDEDYTFYLEYDVKNDKVIGRRGAYGKDSEFKQADEVIK